MMSSQGWSVQGGLPTRAAKAHKASAAASPKSAAAAPAEASAPVLTRSESQKDTALAALNETQERLRYNTSCPRLKPVRPAPSSVDDALMLVPQGDAREAKGVHATGNSCAQAGY